jgi:hypothetical protein
MNVEVKKISKYVFGDGFRVLHQKNYKSDKEKNNINHGSSQDFDTVESNRNAKNQIEKSGKMKAANQISNIVLNNNSIGMKDTTIEHEVQKLRNKRKNLKGFESNYLAPMPNFSDVIQKSRTDIETIQSGSNLNVHSKIIHSCIHCSNSYGSKMNLNRHIRNVHKVQDELKLQYDNQKLGPPIFRSHIIAF